MATTLLIARRVHELFPGSVEVIIITPQQCDAAAFGSGIRVIAAAAKGVYAAYTTGLRHAKGDYVWFLGDDDFPLDCASSLSELLKEGSADVIACPVIFSSGRVYKPSRYRLTLLLRNWCQQGIVYKRATLLCYRFFNRFPVQADHYVNVLLRAQPGVKIVYPGCPVCVFGVNGLSSRLRDERFRKVRKLLARRTLGFPQLAVFGSIVWCRAIVRRMFGW
jgi:glycosyltransferase involved in cell wall biosynthesis